MNQNRSNKERIMNTFITVFFVLNFIVNSSEAFQWNKLSLSILVPQRNQHYYHCSSEKHTTSISSSSSSTQLYQQHSSSSSSKLPSWNDIESILNPSLTHPPPLTIDSSLNPNTKPTFSTTKPTLFRERHGWCPYSERVWLALEVLNVDYDTIYIDNAGYGKRPSYYSGQTPQIRWEDDGSTQGESMDLVRKLNSKYHDQNVELNLYPEEIQNEVINKIRAFEQIYPKRTRPSSRAAFLFRYDGEPLWKNEFEKVLRETNELLGQTSSSSDNNDDGNGGPFFCGKQFTAADIAWAPFLERYAAQLPCLHDGLHPRTDKETYPHLVAWYDAMDNYIPSYSCRVKGDASSWRKVLTMAGFGNAGVPMDVSKRMEDVQEEEQQPLTELEKENQQRVWDIFASSRPWVASSAAVEAASVMTRNRVAIIKDIEKRIGKNNDDDQYSDLAACSEDDIDEAMRAMICLLCEDEKDFHDNLVDGAKDYARVVKSLAIYLDDRMCVPRDMGSYSAATIKRLIPRIETFV